MIKYFLFVYYDCILKILSEYPVLLYMRYLVSIMFQQDILTKFHGFPFAICITCDINDVFLI